MNQLILRDVNYNFIPKPAQKYLGNIILNWYVDTLAYEDVPMINEEMIFADPLAKQYFLDYFTDVTDYLYVHETLEEQDSSIFPVEKSHWPDYVWEKCHNAFVEMTGELETGFVLDVKRYLDVHQFFYRDELDWTRTDSNLNMLHNKPVVTIW